MERYIVVTAGNRGAVVVCLRAAPRGSCSLSRLVTPCGNSVTRNRTTTNSSMRVVRALARARRSSLPSPPPSSSPPWSNLYTRSSLYHRSFMSLLSSLYPRSSLYLRSSLPSRPRNLCRRCSAIFSARTSSTLITVSPQHGTSFTSSAWIQKLSRCTNSSTSLSSLNVTTQMTSFFVPSQKNSRNFHVSFISVTAKF